MNREKVMLNNRTFRAYKDGIEFIAKKQGISMTQYVNTLFFEAIKKDIVENAMDNATQQIALKYDIPNRWSLKWQTMNDKVKAALGEKRALQFGKDWADKVGRNIESYCKKIGIEENDAEYAAIMKEFAASNE